LDKAKAILQEAGVLDSHIHTSVSTEDSLITATMNELMRHHYTDVIISKYHHEIIARLLRKGVTDIFRKIPDIEVFTLDLAVEIAKPDI
jgi:hypothetical protein